MPMMVSGIIISLNENGVWSHWRESNPRPLDYESRAIPLSHSGAVGGLMFQI